MERLSAFLGGGESIAACLWCGLDAVQVCCKTQMSDQLQTMDLVASRYCYLCAADRYDNNRL